MEASLAAHDERQKALGAFYTPPPIAERLAAWAVRTESDEVLDPSFGNLVFLDAAAKRLEELGASTPLTRSQLHGFDVDPGALAAATRRGRAAPAPENLVLQDFFDATPPIDGLADVILGNPPYIRYQGFLDSRERARALASAQGVQLSRLASSWAPFVVHGATFLRPGGRMAQVLPAEILHAQYARHVLDYLERAFAEVTISVFDERIFPGALEEVVLLFAEGYGSASRGGIRITSSSNLESLDVTAARHRTRERSGRRTLLAQLLPESTQDLLERCRENASTLGEIASVDIGLVTGANDFFTLTASQADQFGRGLVELSVSKAAHVRGAVLSPDDHERLAREGHRAFLLFAERELRHRGDQALDEWIRWGEKQGFSRRYKCSIREPWWRLPAQDPPDLLLTYCSSEHPRIALNAADARHTNTLHGVRTSASHDGRLLAAGFYNSLTLLSCELEGRSYGGGVLKLEPTEAEQVLLPPLDERLIDLLPAVDRAIRQRDLSTAAAIVDEAVLVGGLQLSGSEIEALREARQLLAERRRRRGAKPKS